MSNPFRILGNAEPFFRAVFSGIEFPIKDRDDLIKKAGGPDRLVIITDPSGNELVHSLLDLLAVWPELDTFFPMRSAEAVAKQFATLEVRRRSERKTSPLLKIGGKNLAKIVRKRPLPVPSLEPIIRFSGFPKEAPTSTALLKAFAAPEGQKILRRMDATNVAVVMLEYIKFILQWIENYHRDAALSAAAEAEQYATQAENAANAAQNSEKNVASSTTNAIAQQHVDQTCAYASQAQSAAQQAVNAAASACAHASSVPQNVEAQQACGKAQSAAAKAQAAAIKAAQACSRAQDIASISIVTICGHVNEEDPCCDDDVDGATIEICNLNYPEIPCATAKTDKNGNYCVTGRFGHSSRVGCASVRVTMYSGPDWGDLALSKNITVCSQSPTNVNFSFDVPGVE